MLHLSPASAISLTMLTSIVAALHQSFGLYYKPSKLLNVLTSTEVYVTSIVVALHQSPGLYYKPSKLLNVLTSTEVYVTSIMDSLH